MRAHQMHIGKMQLDQWMTENGVSDADLAARVGRDRTVISKLRKGQIGPSIEVLGAITRITDGQVTVEDFLAARSREAGSEAA